MDDDNVLAGDYLEQAVEIGRAWPMLGGWGGQSIPEFETPPPEWSRRYLHMLALREFQDDRWSNQSDGNATPIGAGMCIRRALAQKFADMLANDPLRRQLDRKGQSLVSGGDTDMMHFTCTAGYGTGIFSRLRLTHLIPRDRLTHTYLTELYEGIAYSLLLLGEIDGKPLPRPTRPRRLVNWLRALTLDARERGFRLARMRGGKGSTPRTATVTTRME